MLQLITCRTITQSYKTCKSMQAISAKYQPSFKILSRAHSLINQQ